MDYYLYVILIFAIVLKLTVYLCWYQFRRNAARREVRIIMPDGTTRCAVISTRGRALAASRSRTTSEERQILPNAEYLSPYDNQGLVENPVQPQYMTDGTNPLGPTPYFPNQEWKLPKYEEIAGMPPPYTAQEPEVASAAQPGDTAPIPNQSLFPPPTYPSGTSHLVMASSSQVPNQQYCNTAPAAPTESGVQTTTTVNTSSLETGPCILPTSIPITEI